MQNIVPDFRNLSSHPPGTKAPVAQTMAKGAKNTSQKRKTSDDDYLFWFINTRFGGPAGAYYGNNNKQKNDGNKRPRREDGDGNPPNDEDPDDDDDDKDGDHDDSTPNIDGHRLSVNNGHQLATTEVVLSKPGAILPTLHPKQLHWDG